MTISERFSGLPEYAFPRLRSLLDAHAPGGDVIHMSIGEPRHPFPHWIASVITENLDGFGRYPPNDGTPELLEAVAGWYQRRHGVSLDPDRQIMALNGSREGLYNACVALCPETVRGKRPVVLVPNPFYQAYAVGARAVGAEVVYVPATAATGFLPDYRGLPADILNRTAIAYVCTPSNPQGAVADRAFLGDLVDLAEHHGFRVFSDECYSEIYRADPPPGAHAVAAAAGADPERVVVFESLSKRSNLPGLRSGFVAGGPQGMAQIRQLRAYAGAPLPLPLQRVAERLWTDEEHVAANRALYAEKYDVAETVFGGVQGFTAPAAGFFLWLPVDDGEAAALRLWTETGVRVLPGAYLGRDVAGDNPGRNYIRVALVAPRDDVQRGLTRIRDCLYS